MTFTNTKIRKNSQFGQLIYTNPKENFRGQYQFRSFFIWMVKNNFVINASYKEGSGYYRELDWDLSKDGLDTSFNGGVERFIEAFNLMTYIKKELKEFKWNDQTTFSYTAVVDRDGSNLELTEKIETLYKRYLGSH